MFICFLILGSCSNRKQQAYCWTNNVNIRDVPASDGKVIGQLDKNQLVTLTGAIGDSLTVILGDNVIPGFWVEITTAENKTGWVISAALSCSSDENDSAKSIKRKEILADTLYYIPPNTIVPVYKKPQPGAEIKMTYSATQSILSDQTFIAREKCTGMAWEWVSVASGSGGGYILRSNLKLRDELIQAYPLDYSLLDWFFGDISDTEIVYFKSLKKFKNGDDGAEWEEDSQLNFQFYNNILSTGYMYNYEYYHVVGLSEKNGIYSFLAYVFDPNDIRELQMKFSDDGTITLLGNMEISCKYIPGTAMNY